MEYLQTILKLDQSNGEVWGSLGNDVPGMRVSNRANGNQGHCFLMMEDLQQAYAAYQQALYHLRDPKVSFPPGSIFLRLIFVRNQNYGTVSVFYTIVMAPLSMPKKPFPKS